MALTSEQEQKVAQIIAAFENGKTIADLPDVGETNPFDLYCEVLDIDGESKKAALSTMLPYLEEQCAYGIEFDTTISSPLCTRVGNMDLHRSLPIQSRMRGCLLNDNGDVVKYLDPLDWTNEVRDGSQGQVMVELPMHYVRFITDGTKRRVMMSEYPLPAYKQVKKAYVGAYEAATDRTNQKLCSVRNFTTQYRGMYSLANTWDDNFRSCLGRPSTAQQRGTVRNYARKRKPTTTEWNCFTYDLWKEIYWLYMVEYANLNCQAAFNSQRTEEGFMQGGLGAGVTGFSSWWSSMDEDKFQCAPIIPCGYTDSLGNRSGYIPYDVIGYDGQLVHTTNPNRYRGIEIPWGHFFRWIDGINVEIVPPAEEGGTRTIKVWVCSDPSLFNDSGYEGYRYAGNQADAEAYTKEIVFGEEGDLIPSATGGGSTTYICDYNNQPAADVVTLRAVVVGGNAQNGTNAGLAYFNSNYTPASSSASIASRLCFIPETTNPTI